MQEINTLMVSFIKKTANPQRPDAWRSEIFLSVGFPWRGTADALTKLNNARSVANRSMMLWTSDLREFAEKTLEGFRQYCDPEEWSVCNDRPWPSGCRQISIVFDEDWTSTYLVEKAFDATLIDSLPQKARSRLAMIPPDLAEAGAVYKAATFCASYDDALDDGELDVLTSLSRDEMGKGSSGLALCGSEEFDTALMFVRED